MAKPQVKVIKVKHSIFGQPSTRGVEKQIQKWMSKGYRLDKQQDESRPGCGRAGYTMLTFIKE